MKNDLSKIASELVTSYGIDVALFAEHQALDINKFKAGAESYNFLEDKGCEKIIIFHKKDISASIRRGAHYYRIISVETETGDLIITGLHLPAMESGREDRLAVIEDIVPDICEQERKINSQYSIVIGDFNADPFDIELTGHRYFNAVLFLDLINRHETVTFNHKKYRRFYNPMLNYISETEKHYGSYYYHNKNRPIYWHCLDQIIVRKPLADKILNVEYCRKIDKKPLVTKNGIVNERYSDHLPLIAELNI